MASRGLLPWHRGRQPSTARDSDLSDPFTALHRQIERAFDDVFSGIGSVPVFGGSGAGLPAIDVRETDREIEVCAELPGFQEKDIDVSLNEDTLTIKAQREEENEDKRKDYVYSERSRGSVQRIIQIPENIDPDTVSATYENGVLTVHLQKTQAKSSARRIPLGKGQGAQRGRQASEPMQHAAQQPQSSNRQQR